MKTIGWKREPKGPGLAFHMFIDAGGERVQLLAYDVPADPRGPHKCGFEIFGRRRGRKRGPFDQQLAAGEADSLEAAKAAAEAMAAQPRDKWTKRSR